MPPTAIDAPPLGPPPKPDEGLAARQMKQAIRAGLFGLHADPVKVDRFTILRRLGAGAMGVVFAAYDERLDRKIALKLLHPERSDDRQLLREAQALARLAHPNVVVVHEVGIHEGQVFLAMEFIEGHTLRTWLASPRPWRELVARFVEAGRGLAAAHATGLVHRDFKPDNVLVGTDGRTRVLDFGLARRADGDGPVATSPADPEELADVPGHGASLTLSDNLAGTPAYMAPEVLAGRRPDARSDQFSFCVALYEGLYGQRPLRAASTRELLATTRQIRAPPSAARVPAWLGRVVLRGLSPEPGARWPSMSALLAELGRDPSRARRRWLARAAVAGAIGLAAVAPLREPTPAAPSCDGTLTGTWDEPRRELVYAAFLATSVPYASAIGEQVASRLDAHADQWLAEHRNTCEAFHVRGEQSSQLFDLRMGCLGRRRTELQALTDLLVVADSATTERAVQAIDGLTPVSSCSDLEALAAALPLPEDATVRGQVEELRIVLGRARALRGTGKYREGRALADSAVAEARALAYDPTLAEALLVAAELHMALGEANVAEQSLHHAITAAAAARHDEVTASAWIDLVRVVGTLQDRYEDGLAWSRVAEAAVTRAGDDPHSRALLLLVEGDILREQGHTVDAIARYEVAARTEASSPAPKTLLLADIAASKSAALADAARYDEALASQLEALALRELTLAPGHPDVAIAHDQLGTLLVLQGKYREAREHIELALTRAEALGPRHPTTALIRKHLGTFLHEQGEHEAGMEHLTAALALQEEVLGPDHRDVATTLTSLGTALHRQGDYAGALVHHRRALASLERSLGADHPDVAAALDLVGMDLASVGEQTQALGLFRRALAIMESRLGPMHPNIASAHSHVASALYLLGRLEEALDHDLQGLAIDEQSLGRDHIGLAVPHYNLGLSYSELGIVHGDMESFRKARWHFERALAINEVGFGPQHAQVAIALSGLGGVLLRLDARAEALPLLERALAISATTELAPLDLAELEFALGQALVDEPGQRARAVRLVQGAHARFVANGEAGEHKAGLARDWLSERGEAVARAAAP